MRQYTRQVIRRNVFAAMLLAPLIPVVLALGAGGYLFWSNVQQTTLERLEQLSSRHAYVLDQYVEDLLGDLSLLGEQMAAVPDSGFMQGVLQRLEGKHREAVDVALMEPDGKVLAYAGPGVYKGSHVMPGRWLDEALERGASVGEVMAGQLGLPHFVLARRLSVDGKNLVMRVSLDPEVFTRLLMDVHEEGVDALLITREGEIIAGSGGQILTRDRELLDPGFLDKIGHSFRDKGSGDAYASAVMRNGGWIVSVRKHSRSFFGVTDSTILFLGLFLLGGGVIVLLSSLYLTGYIEKMLLLRDEERESLREQLYRAGRLAELGEMAAGFAHEINNPLQIIKSDQAYIEMLLQDFRERAGEDEAFLADVEEVVASVNQIKVQIDRCARITHSILSFGRAGNVEEQNLDLAKFVPEVVTMVQKKMQLSNISLKVNIAPVRLIVHVDAGRMQQVLLNLLNNAMYAIGETADGRAGEITLTCAADGADKVRISIADNGIGIGADQQQLVFTPFFTTKPAGSGTGLGLSVCHSLVSSMKGVLDFTSVKGQGSTFFVLLPRVQSVAA